MLGHGGAIHVKCEPPSDEEDYSPQLADLFLTKLSSGFTSVNTVESASNQDNEGHKTALMQQLQQSSRLEELAPLTPAAPSATPVCVKTEPGTGDTSLMLETLESTPHITGSFLLERHLAMLSSTRLTDSADFLPLQTVKDEPSSEGEAQALSSDEASDSCGVSEANASARGSPKGWSQADMEGALNALKNQNMSLTKASSRYGIPSTTLWQRARRLGIDTPKKEGAPKSWSDADLRAALQALRHGSLSANKASKAYGIPSSTLYKIARREGIRLAAPFNAAPVAWRRADLPRALAAIRAGAAVQRAALHYNIPTGTLYGRCKREGIELSRSNPTPWSEDAMGEALEAVRVGQMSINQAAIHYNLPYSSLYGRFKRCKYQNQQISQEQHHPPDNPSHTEPSYHDTTPAYHETTPPYHEATPPYHETTPPYQYHDVQDYTMYYQGLTTNSGFNGITTS